MNIETELKKVPAYGRFFTLDEMLVKARAVSKSHPDIFSYEEVGRSSAGEAIPMLRAGSGDTRVLLFASPHPNEPIGAMLIQFLLDELLENEPLRDTYTWYLLPCADPDGTRLNEGWFGGPFTIDTYARHFYRPPSAEQAEWTFPIHYKDLHFDTPLPETSALMNAFDMARPHVVYSLHNAGFGGVYYYISPDMPQVYDAFHKIPEQRGLALSLGEAEMPWAVEFAPAVYHFGSIKDAYDYFELYSETPPAELIQGGGASSDYLRSMQLASDPIMLITELPYFQSAQIADQTPLAQTRRDIVLEGIERALVALNAVKTILDTIAPEMTLDTRFYRAVTLFNAQALDALPSKEAWVKDASGMDEAATVAQRTDELYVAGFYRLLIVSMLRRALDAQLEQQPSETLTSAKADLETLLDTWTQDLENNLEYEAIPIKTLVEVQYGALLAILNHAPTPQKGSS